MKAKGLYSAIYNRLTADEDNFPSLPEVIMRLRDEMERPSCDIRSLSHLIQVDPALTAYVIQAARSIRFFTLSSVKGLDDAVRRMGLSETYHVALSFFARSQFEIGDRRLARDLKRVYLTSVKTAAISALLASRQKKIGPSRAILAALLQDVGSPLVLSALAEREEEYPDALSRAQALDEVSPLVGLLILGKWGFDEELKEVVRNRRRWDRDHRGRADLSDVVLVATRHALIDMPDGQSLPPLTGLPAFARIDGLTLTPDNSLRLIRQSSRELADIEHLLAPG